VLRVADSSHHCQDVEGERPGGGLSFTDSGRAERHDSYDHRGDNAFHNNLLNCVASMKQIRQSGQMEKVSTEEVEVKSVSRTGITPWRNL
jgi:hypothetical protein